MSWVTIIWSMVASACLTLAVMHFAVWCMKRTAWANVAFAVAALAVAGIAAGEFQVMRASTPEEMGAVMRWMDVPIFVLVAALVGFVGLDFRTGRPWLGWTAVVLQFVSLILNFTSGTTDNYREITTVRHIEFLGQPVSVVAKAVANPWGHMSELSMLFLLVFVAEAAARLWQAGGPENRRRALLFGGSIVGFILVAAGFSALIENQVIQAPYLISLPFLAIVLVMNYELSREVVNAAQLADDLQESEERFRLLMERAPEAILVHDLEQDRFVQTNAQAERLFGCSRQELLASGPQRFYTPKQPDGQPVGESMRSYSERALRGETVVFERTICNALGQRLDCEVRLVSLPGGERKLVRASFFDITARKRAETALRDLNRRLIRAHEEERARLARELHDDVTQRLARLAIDAGRAERGAHEVSPAETMRSVRDGLVGLSEDIHALSYRLHPSVLEDLGLAEALKAECERVSRQQSFTIDVKLRELPGSIPPDTALGLFRVAQEALRNVVRHAQARTVEVSMRVLDGGLQLAVRDDGAGFAPALQREHPTLGLASMRERVQLLEGELDIESAPGQGTTIVAWVPLKGASS